MGYGGWSGATYSAKTSAKVASGTTFGYDATARSTGAYVPHADLDPKKVVNAQGFIEARDSDEHPNSVPIIVGLDHTGSMGGVPRTLQKKLPDLFGLLLRKGYVEDPQISIAAYGDTYTDECPVEISNFESDNRIDENLDNLVLYGGGGGNGGETMTGIWYMMTKCRTDSWEKRGKKGYAFFIADEITLDLKAEHVKEFIGDGEPLAPLTVTGLAKAIKEQWEVYILLIDNMSARSQRSEAFYTNLFDAQHVLVLEDPNSVSETIALAIGVGEGTVDLDEGIDDLRSTGTSVEAINSASNALRRAGLDRLPNRGAVVKGNANLDLGDGPAKTRRL